LQPDPAHTVNWKRVDGKQSVYVIPVGHQTAIALIHHIVICTLAYLGCRLVSKMELERLSGMPKMKHAFFDYPGKLSLAAAIVIALICSGARIAGAAPQLREAASGDESQRKDCSGGGEQEMVACVVAEHKAADLELNKLYKQVKEQISPEDQKNLIVAQRAWIKRRDAQCALEMGHSNGDADAQTGTSSLLYSGQMNNCLARLTLARIEELKAQFPATAEVHSVNKPQFEIELLESTESDFIHPAVGINDAGQIAGSIGSKDGQDATRTIIWKDGSLTELPISQKPEFNPLSINQAGELAGSLHGQATDEHAAVWKNAAILDLDSDENRKTYISRATGINTSGQVVGWSFTLGSDPTATLWDDGKVVDLGASLKKQGYSEAHAINDAGRIVGRFDELARTKSGRKILGSYAVSWQATSVKVLSTIGGRNSSADGINNRGQIVGWSNIKGSTGYAWNSPAHATLWEHDTVIDLGGLSGFMRTSALAINNAGQIVGSADNPQIGAGFIDSGDHHALYWDSTRRMFDLNRYLPLTLGEAGWVLTEATGINNGGVIVGTAYNDQTHLSRVFVLKPAKP
jgi:probable HAF family extracellular repeat protein